MKFWPPRSIVLFSLSLCLITVLPACGQKGDLYHPEEKQSALNPGRHAA